MKKMRVSRMPAWESGGVRPVREPAMVRMGRRTGRSRLVGIFTLLLVVAGLALIGHSALTMMPAAATPPPEDMSLRLTVPAMSHAKDVPVYDAPANDEGPLETGALHVQGTGFPWQAEANVYIAGHRLGYPGTGSYLLFYDLDKLENGDEVILTDANGTTYTYQVFDKFVVAPTDLSVMEPAAGANIVSLQTCTLPDYSQRLIVQAELVSVS